MNINAKKVKDKTIVQAAQKVLEQYAKGEIQSRKVNGNKGHACLNVMGNRFRLLSVRNNRNDWELLTHSDYMGRLNRK